MAITKIPVSCEFGVGELTESRVKLSVPGVKGKYTFVQLTDLHITAYEEGDSAEAVELAKARAEFWANQAGFFVTDPASEETKKLLPVQTIELVAKRVREIAPDIVFFTGDTVDFPSVANFRYTSEYLRSLGTEVAIVPGNHDTIGEDSSAELSEAFCEAVGNLDDFNVQSFGEFDVISINDGFVEVTAEQVENLRAQLELNRPTIILLHAPILTESAKLPVCSKWGPNWNGSERNSKVRKTGNSGTS